MKCQQCMDIHTDIGYRRADNADDVKGYGMRGMCLLRRGVSSSGKELCTLWIDRVCKSHRLTVGSSYGAELLAASH
eukprot:11649491-Karenia_brevis.AAC.1